MAAQVGGDGTGATNSQAGNARPWWPAPHSGPFPPGKDPLHIEQKTGPVSGPIWMGPQNLTTTGIRSLDRSARSVSLHWLTELSPAASRQSYLIESVGPWNISVAQYTGRQIHDWHKTCDRVLESLNHSTFIFVQYDSDIAFTTCQPDHNSVSVTDAELNSGIPCTARNQHFRVAILMILCLRKAPHPHLVPRS